LNDNINVGTYGWRHSHWLSGFYHEDMPQEWQLAYYSNEFNCVLVPADYWQADHGYDCDSWLDDVHEDFVFYLELPATLATDSAKQQFLQQVSLLQPQLAGIVINESACQAAELLWLQTLAVVSPLYLMAATHFDDKNLSDKAVYPVWTDTFLQNYVAEKPWPVVSGLAVLHDDLSDFRQFRQTLASYFEAVKSEAVKHEAVKNDAIKNKAVENEVRAQPHSIIVINPDISDTRLAQLRSVIEIMGL
jgi:hypothetical protein